MDLLCLKEHHARTLLICYRWNADKLFAVLVEKGKDCLFAEAGLSLVGIHDLDSQPPPTVMCNICMEDVPGTEVTKMDCGHSFCNECKSSSLVCSLPSSLARYKRSTKFQKPHMAHYSITA